MYFFIKMTLRIVLSVILVLINFITSQTSPNIVLILADDVGWNDVGFHGSNQIPTPNIDALAYSGLILNRFYSLPTCSPSRSALLTGQYPIRLGLQGLPISTGENRYLPQNTPLLPEKLKSLGYRTYLIGKWHLGASHQNVTPTKRGFDYHFGYWNGYVGYFDHYAYGEGMVGLDMFEAFAPMWKTRGQYLTHLLTDKAENIIKTHNQSEPLFLTLSHLAAHTGKDGSDLEVPDEVENDKTFGYIKDIKRRRFAGIMSELDNSVGRVMESLTTKGILNNTIVLLISDNGAQTEGVHENGGSNWPLRGLKFSMHDGGVRSVAVLYTSKLEQKGVVTKELFHISDIFPTLYTAAGGNVNDLKELDGKDQWASLITHGKSSRSELLLNIDERENVSGIIGEKGRFKLLNGSTVYDITYGGYFGDSGRSGIDPPYNITAVVQSKTNIALGNRLTIEQITKTREKATLEDCRTQINVSACTAPEFCLFDLLDDPCENNNLLKRRPEIVETLSRKLTEYWKLIKPQEKTDVDARANPIYNNNTWFNWMDYNYFS